MTDASSRGASTRPTTRPRCSRRSTGRTERRDLLPRVQHAARIERQLDAAHQLDGARPELTLHVRELGRSDAVLAGERPTHVQHGLEELAGSRIGACALALDARIDEEGGVHVAVAEVTEVHHRQLVLGSELAGAGDQLGDAVPGHDDVLVHLADLHLGNRGAHRLARRPEPLRLPGLGGTLELRGPGARDRGARGIGVRPDRRGVSLELDDQQRLGVTADVAAPGLAHRLEGGGVEELHRRRHDSRRADLRRPPRPHDPCR